MCGRLTIVTPLEALMDRFFAQQTAFDFTYENRYNAAPGQLVAVILENEGKRYLGGLRWGLIPSWAKDEKVGYMMINARAETVDDKPAFRSALSRRRCLIPADGYYEWQKRADGTKQPMRIVRKDGGLFAFAGLYDAWQAPDGRKIGSFTIITTGANALTEQIHDRMPVILPREHEGLWLDRGTTEPALLKPLLVPYPSDELEYYPVDPKVGNVRNDTPELIERFESYSQQELF